MLSLHSGGGIGGLCLAVALSRYPDIQVDVYEAAERFKEIGAGVMIWSRTWEILTLLGMASDFSQIAHATPDGSLGMLRDARPLYDRCRLLRFCQVLDSITASLISQRGLSFTYSSHLVCISFQRGTISCNDVYMLYRWLH